MTKIVTAEAGKTVSVDLGGGGREVTGKLIIPSGVSVSGNTYLIGTAIPVLPPIDAMPPAIKASNPERQQQWMRQFSMTPQGAEFLKAHPEFAPPIQPYWVESSDSKTFRLEGVEPGDYYLQVYVQVPYRQGSVRLAGAEANFTMPPITPDVADQPLTVGDVSMRLITPMPRDAAPQTAAGLTTAGQTTFIGKVIDAQTHQPVDGIVPLLGRALDASQPLAYVANMGQAININPMLASQVRLKPFDGGQYTLSLPANYPANCSWFVRVEARGYLPALSSAQHGSATVDFALTPAKDIVGHVYGIDGKPEAGVALGVAIPGLPSLGVRDGALVGFAAAAATSAADGAYDLPPQTGEFTIVACGPDGITKANQDDIAKSPDIHLLPWGGIEGRAIVGDKPMVGSDIIASSPNYNAPASSDYSSLRFSATVQADENGNFSFAKLPPGEVQIYRHFSQILGPQYPQIHLAGNAQTIRETIEPGKTTTLNLGASGREVEVHIIFPSNLGNDQFNLIANVMAVGPPPAGPPMPDDVKNGTREAQQEWMRTYLASPAGRAFQQSQILLAMAQPVNSLEYSDGNTFHIEGVQPGDYRITVSLTRTGGQPGPGGRRIVVIRPTQATFTMPPITPDIANKPLVLPDITLPAN